MTNNSKALLVVLSMAIVFAIDLRLPNGVAAGILYVAPVLLTFWLRRNPAPPLLAAAAATILILAAFALAEPQARVSPYALTNRLLAAGAVWAAAALVALYTRADEARRRSEQSAREGERQLDQIRQALGRSEAASRAYLEAASQAVLGVDETGRIVLANAMAEETFGYSREELLAATMEMLLPELFQGRPAPGVACLAAPGPQPMGARHELVAQRKDGSSFRVDVSLSPIVTPDGNIALAFVSDISARIQAQEELREAHDVRALTAGLLRGQEQERQRISRQLHDGVNQRLAALSMELSTLENHIADPAAARERLSSIENRVVAISDDVRRVSHQLHPSILEHAGFVAALRSHCREFSIETAIETQITTDAVPEPIDPVAASCLFRLSQDALQNVARHSGATQVRITVSGDGQGIRLSIVDNGKGFDVARARGQGGLGLLSMSERARSLRGRLTIESSPQGGAAVVVSVPLA